MSNREMLSKYQNILPSGLFRTLILATGIIWGVIPLHAQKSTQVYLEHADHARLGSEKGRSFQRLIGNAKLRQDSTYFYCDSASLFESNNLVAVGNVHINYSDSVNLYGDYLTYDGNTRIAILDSNVRLVDKRATLYTDHLEYDRDRAMAYYYTGGRIEDGKNILTSKTGRYFTRTYDFLFSDSVVAVNPDYTMDADTLRYNTESQIVYIEGPTNIYGKEDKIYSEKGWYDTRNNQAELDRNNQVIHLEQILKADYIYYDRENEYGKAVGNVWLKDTVQKIILEGGISEFYRTKKYSYVTDSACAILIDTRDSLYMHADSMILVLDTTGKAKLLFAYHRMKFFRSDLQGMCDSLVYRVKDSVIALLKEPVLWSAENQLTADSMWLYISKNRIDSMVLFNMAFIIARDSTDTFNQIKGKQMRAYFRNNELYLIKVQGNAETIYFVRDEGKEMIGINKTVASNMAIMLDNRKIKQILYLTQPEATLYPEKDVIEEDRFLKDFNWIHQQRPANLQEIFIWKSQ
jgi:lipopolysaccharide export system protein LptA